MTSQHIDPLSDDLASPLPLQGPIGLRTLLLFPSSSPFLEWFVPRRRHVILAVLGGFGGAWAVRFLLRHMPPAQIDDLFYILAVWAASIGDFGFGALGAAVASGAATRWRRQGRVAEAALTSMRPVALAQIILARPLLSYVVVVLSCFAGLAHVALASGKETLILHRNGIGGCRKKENHRKALW